MAAIKTWSGRERPRERLLESGAGALSLPELLAILFGSGTAGRSAIDLAVDVIERFGGLEKIAQATPKELMKVKGIGEAKAILLAAALELNRRRSSDEIKPRRFDSVPEIAGYLKVKLQDQGQELFVAVMLNRNLELLGDRIVNKGGIYHAVLDTTLLVKEALLTGASQLLVAHNHLSHEARPSRADYVVTQKMIETCKAAGVPLLDHLIVSRGDYFSFRNESQMWN